MTLDEFRGWAVVDRGHGHHGWPAPYAQAAVTLEEADLLHALVRATKPRLVLELGTGLGVSAKFIGEALAANGAGELVTVEPLEGIRRDVRESGLLDGLPVTITDYAGAATVTPDLVFVDSGADHRAADLNGWLRRGYTGIVVVHDAFREYGDLDLAVGLAVGVTVPTCEGLWIGRATGKKPRPSPTKINVGKKCV